MDKLKAIVRAKPTWVVLLIFSYILILGVLKWRLTPDSTTVYYLLGGLFGVYFLDVAEVIFDIRPSPFRSMLFVVLFCVVSFFVVTSSGSMFASGLVLSLYFSLLLLQAEDWQRDNNLNSWFAWFSLVREPPTVKIQQICVIAFSVFLMFETLLFIRSGMYL